MLLTVLRARWRAEEFAFGYGTRPVILFPGLGEEANEEIVTCMLICQEHICWFHPITRRGVYDTPLTHS